MLVKKTKTIETHNYDNADYKNWIDFSNVRRDFNCYAFEEIPLACNSFRITLFIQPESDSSPSSFCAFSIARRNSGSSLNWNGGLPRLFSDMCIDTPITLMVMYLYVMTCYYHMLEKAIPRSVPPLSRDLTKPLKLEVMIMANRYDNAQHYPEQYKLFKFFDLSTTDILKVIAQNEQQAKKILGRSSLIFIARFPLNRMPEYFYFTSLEGVNHE